ncbi:helix-turn-helix domain-containing protein [Streptomyces sp. NPDC091266]|uniref:helix-turn-helix domain-containing protein n=1 Tax=Streptomyces sp. NPDC091266 TaxID=3365978 RepID=UPI0037F40388
MPPRRFDGRQIRRVRRERDLTQMALAKPLGVSRATVAQWEAGKTFPDGDRLPALADVLEHPLDALFPRDGEPDLTDLRCDAGLSQGNAAEAAGLGRTALGDAERGLRRLDTAQLEKLGGAYGVPIGQVLAAQACSFGDPPSPADVLSRSPESEVDQLVSLLRRLPEAVRPSDAQVASMINAEAQRHVVSAEDVSALRAGGSAEPVELHETPLQAVLDGLSAVLVVGLVRTGEVQIAARGAEGGIAPDMLSTLNEYLLRSSRT